MLQWKCRLNTKMPSSWLGIQVEPHHDDCLQNGEQFSDSWPFTPEEGESWGREGNEDGEQVGGRWHWGRDGGAASLEEWHAPHTCWELYQKFPMMGLSEKLTKGKIGCDQAISRNLETSLILFPILPQVSWALRGIGEADFSSSSPKSPISF